MKTLEIFTTVFIICTLISLQINSQIQVESSGNVGIGTTSPNNLLEVDGLINFDDTYYNTFLGKSSGASNTSGSYNTFLGYLSGNSNTSGSYNSSLGYQSGYDNLTGNQNACFGFHACDNNTSSYNTAVGSYAGHNNTSGNCNIYIGQQAGYYTTTGYCNTMIGFHTGWANTTGNYITLLGYGASANGAAYTNSTAIGCTAIVTASNYIRIGNTSVTQIGGQVAWSTLSDGRFKTNVTENVKGLEFINKLRPVTYKMNTQQLDAFVKQNMAPDSSGNGITGSPVDYSASMAIIHSGFIAQEVDSVAQLCGYESSIVHTPANSNDPYSIAYAEFVVPLVKAVQELNQITTDQAEKIEALSAIIDEQEEKINSLETEIINCCSIEKSGTGQTIVKPLNEEQKNLLNSSDEKTSPALYQNIPNPFYESTTIKYVIPEDSQNANLYLLNMQGTVLKNYTIIERGKGDLLIPGSELVAGVYFYMLMVDNKEVGTKKMILTNQ